jgi:3'-phosphoadenosine 5'-phosphosulfate sulfotransferase (PAPS reductase)/FAD synthetase
MKNEIVLKPSHWAFVSGGKDSLYMLNLILHNLDKYPLDGVVHFELEIDYPFIKNVINYMESECKRFGIPFFRIKPRTKWIDFYNKYGFPIRIARWCNSMYKLDSIKQLEEFLASNNCYVVNYIGYCADESNRAETKIQQKRKNIYPLIENNCMEDDILEWAKKQPIFNDYYKYNRRCGCMYCPLQSMQNTAYLMKYYPAEYKQMIAYAKATEEMREETLGRLFSVWSSNPKYNTEYRDKRVREVYLPKLEEIALIDKRISITLQSSL